MLHTLWTPLDKRSKTGDSSHHPRKGSITGDSSSSARFDIKWDVKNLNFMFSFQGLYIPHLKMSLDLVCSRGWIWKFGSTMVFTPNMRSGGFAAARDGCPAGTIACWYSRPSIDGICWWMDRRRGQLGSQNDLALHTNSPTSSYTNWHHSTWEAPLRKKSCFPTNRVAGFGGSREIYGR